MIFIWWDCLSLWEAPTLLCRCYVVISCEECVGLAVCMKTNEFLVSSWSYLASALCHSFRFSCLLFNTPRAHWPCVWSPHCMFKQGQRDWDQCKLRTRSYCIDWDHVVVWSWRVIRWSFFFVFVVDWHIKKLKLEVLVVETKSNFVICHETLPLGWIKMLALSLRFIWFTALDFFPLLDIDSFIKAWTPADKFIFNSGAAQRTNFVLSLFVTLYEHVH